MPHALSALELDEVSLVDDPANKGARVLLFKRNSPQETPMPELKDVLKAIRTAIDPLVKGDAEKTAALDAAFASAETGETEAEKTAKAAAEKTAADLAKAQDEIAVLKMTDDERACYDKLSDEDKKKFRAADDKGRQGFMRARKGEGDDVVKTEQVEAMIAEAIGKATATAKAEADTLRADLKKANDTLAANAATADAADLLAKVKATGAAGDHAAIVKTLLPLDAAGREAVLTTLKAAGEVLKSAKAFEEIGSPVAKEGSPLATLQTKAEALQKADPKLTKAEALAKAAVANPELYGAYRAELNA